MKRIAAMALTVTMLMTSVLGFSKPVELVWYLPGGGTFPYTDSKVVYDAVNEILAKNLNVVIDFKVPGAPGQYNDLMPLNMAAGEKMDLIFTSHWSNNYVKAASNGLYAPLDTLLPKLAPTIWKDTKDMLTAAKVNGKIYGVWGQQIAAKTSNLNVRDTLISKYGWDFAKLKSPADIEPMLAQVKAGEPELIPLSTRKPVAEWMLPYLGITGVGILPEVLGTRVDDGKVKVFSLIDDAKYLEMVNLSRSWYEKGYLAKDGFTYSNDQWGQMKNSGKVAFDFHNTWKPGEEVTPAPFGGMLVTAPFGQSFVEGLSIIANLTAVSSRSKNIETSVKVMEYFWTHPEVFNMIVWGLEGRHYTKTADGKIQPDPKAGYFTNSAYIYGNTFLSYPVVGSNPAAAKMTYDLNQRAKKAKTMGFSLNLDSIKTQVAMVTSVKDQFYVPVVNGYIDPVENLPKYRAALKKAGIDELLAEIQKQLDAWAKANNVK